MNDVKVLYAIASHDPSDGGRVEPTETSYDAFKAWALRLFGQRSWDAYSGQPWANVPE